ncbi:SEL1-like repeat protein [Inquilinus sp.]|uniref:SEL1-like repeat protein n=1 Tax=Inquilinus sp. TaxID=1932117 RepID=UPI0031D3AF18
MAALQPGSDVGIPVRNGIAALPLPDNASAELRRLARDALAGQADAENDLGTFFALGIEVSRSLEQAAYWYRRAADQGVASASYNLGVLLERGLGVPRDPEEAVARFRDAAAAGHPGALNALGLAYLNGSGAAHDPQEALAWFLRASAAGNPRGAYNAGRLYESGELGAPDPSTAAGWYRVAADAGDAQAEASLTRLEAFVDADTPRVSRAGFIDPAPREILLTPGPAGTSDDDADRILNQLASRLAPPISVDAPDIPGSDMPGTRLVAAADRPLTTAEIIEVQQLLAAAGFYRGRINGRMGRKIRSAVAAFQRSHDIPATGRPSSSLLAALRTATLVAQGGSAEVADSRMLPPVE